MRAEMIDAVRRNAMVLQAVHSDDIDGTGRVVVTADVAITGNAEAALEKIVSRLGLEPGVSSVSWKMVPTEPDEQAILPEA